MNATRLLTEIELRAQIERRRSSVRAHGRTLWNETQGSDYDEEIAFYDTAEGLLDDLNDERAAPGDSA